MIVRKSIIGVLICLCMSFTTLNVFAETTEEVPAGIESFDMAAFEQLVIEIEEGKINSDLEADKRLEELKRLNKKNPNTDIQYSGSIANALGKSAEMQACLNKIGSYKCGKARINAQAAINMATAYYSKDSLNNGKGDAFRHAYWNALMCKSIGCSNAKIVADNHERYNMTEKKLHDMDYYNNQKGRDMYNWRVANGYSLLEQAMADNLRQDIRNGLLKYIKQPEGWLLWTNQ
ncbi:hypothetical protein ABEX39_21455 [Bacillus albus]|uniref:DUF6973 domain-containing protein n=1 Tax=Bacillus TaxID=1386 RepID=UPI003AA8E182